MKHAKKDIETNCTNNIQITMHTPTALTPTAIRRMRKDELVAKVQEMSKETKEMTEKVIYASVIGGIVGFLVGAGW